MMVIAETDHCEVEYLVQRNKKKYQMRRCFPFFFFSAKKKEDIILATLLHVSNWFCYISLEMALEY